MKKKGHILIIDDDQDVLFTAKTILKKDYENVSTEHSPNRLETLLKKENIDLIILDMNFKAGITSGNEGLFWLKRIKEFSPSTHVLMNTAYGDIKLAVESMKLGATDFLVKPWEKEKLQSTVSTIFQLRKSEKRIEQLEGKELALNENNEMGYRDLIFQSDAMKSLYETIETVAKTDASVLLLGENGTGKEVIARAIHRLSDRSKESIIKVDLGAITESLFESEMFGHVKGAFTDAKSDKPGRFEVADGGTLFLDEIGNLNIAMQVKLLTALENRMVTRVGSNQSNPFDIRLISATNMPLYDMVGTGRFRQDLIYRINTVEIEIPPLRKRVEDIAILSEHFLDMYAKKYQKDRLTLSKNAISELEAYKWPGNVRELQHTLERAVIMSKKEVIDQEDLLMPRHHDNSFKDDSLNVKDVEKRAIEAAIKEANSNMSKAAAILGIGRTTLYRKMKKYGIEE